MNHYVKGSIEWRERFYLFLYTFKNSMKYIKISFDSESFVEQIKDL